MDVCVLIFKDKLELSINIFESSYSVFLKHMFKDIILLQKNNFHSVLFAENFSIEVVDSEYESGKCHKKINNTLFKDP